MATQLYFLDDTSSHAVTSEQFEELCDVPLGFDKGPYLVMANVDFDRDDPGYIHDRMLCEVRLDVVSGLGALLGSDYRQFQLSAVVGPTDASGFDRAPSSRHASLMVTATVPSEGGAGRDTDLPFTLDESDSSGMTPLAVPPRAVFSARRLTSGDPRSTVVLSNIRIVAFQADEVVVKRL